MPMHVPRARTSLLAAKPNPSLAGWHLVSPTKEARDCAPRHTGRQQGLLEKPATRERDSDGDPNPEPAFLRSSSQKDHRWKGLLWLPGRWPMWGLEACPVLDTYDHPSMWIGCSRVYRASFAMWSQEQQTWQPAVAYIITVHLMNWNSSESLHIETLTKYMQGDERDGYYFAW